jgi:hypothetical protein
MEERRSRIGSSNILIITGPCDHDATDVSTRSAVVFLHQDGAARIRQSISDPRCADQSTNIQKVAIEMQRTM